VSAVNGQISAAELARCAGALDRRYWCRCCGYEVEAADQGLCCVCHCAAHGDRVSQALVFIRVERAQGWRP
jgi:hypothetical protein